MSIGFFHKCKISNFTLMKKGNIYKHNKGWELKFSSEMFIIDKTPAVEASRARFRILLRFLAI
jgi:hypothetical protein